MKKLALVILTTAVLSVGLTACGDDGVEALKDRASQGKQAGEAVDKANELNQEQSEELDKYLDE